jgi:hypothetical protein
MYNFVLFLGKLLKGVFYVKDQISRYIAKKRGYSYLSEEELNGLHRRNTSWYDKIKSWIFGNPRRSNIPLYETRTSFVHNMGESTIDFDAMSPRSSRPDLDFEQNMMNSSQYESSEFYINKNLRNSSIYPPPQHRRTQSQPSSRGRESSPSYSHVSRDSRVSHVSIQTSTPTLVHPTPQKPFDVDDSNMLFNSHFLTKILHPFSSEETDKNNDNNDKDNDNKDELEKALLSSDYNEV